MSRFLVLIGVFWVVGFAVLRLSEYSQDHAKSQSQERRADVETITLEDGTRCAIYGEGRKGFEGRAGGTTCDWKCER